MSGNSPTPDQIRRAVDSTMELLGDKITTSFTVSLKIRGTLDIDRIRTMEEVGVLEDELREYFSSGANVLIRRLRSELSTSRERPQTWLPKKKAPKLSRQVR